MVDKQIIGVNNFKSGLQINGSATLTSVSTGTSDNDKIATQGYVDDNGGGISWSTAVNSDIIPDTDSTYDLGDATHAFAIVYADSFDSPATSVFFNVGGLSRFKIDSTGTTYYGSISAGSGSFTVDGATNIVTINSGGFDVDFIVKGDNDVLLINTDAATDKVGIGVVANEKLTVEGVISLDEVSAPSLTTGYGKIYVKSSDSNLYYLDGSGNETNLSAASGSGDVTGPGSSTDNAIARFDGTGGKTLQNSGVTVDDSNNLSGAANIAYTGQSYSAINTLSDGATITPDWDNGDVQTVTLGGNRTIANPSNSQSGGSYTIIIKQDATGSRTVSWGTNYKWPSGTAPTLSTGANAVDIVSFVSDGTNLYGVSQLDFS